MNSNSSLSAHWDRPYSEGRDFVPISSDAIDRILQFLPEKVNKTCLDIGCGTGQLSRELAQRGFNVLGIDASSKAIEIAQSRTALQPPELHYEQLDLENRESREILPTDFGLVICKLVYAFIQDKPAFLSYVASILGNGGLFTVITPLDTMVAPEKQNIAVNHAETLTELQQHFTVEFYTEDSLCTYICKQD